MWDALIALMNALPKRVSAPFRRWLWGEDYVSKADSRSRPVEANGRSAARLLAPNIFIGLAAWAGLGVAHGDIRDWFVESTWEDYLPSIIAGVLIFIALIRGTASWRRVIALTLAGAILAFGALAIFYALAAVTDCFGRAGACDT